MLFFDRTSPLGKLERTPQGGYYADAKIARTGIMLYSAKAWRDKGVDVPTKFKDTDLLRVYLPASVLAEAADSLRASAVTNDHPPEMIGPGNYQRYNQGAVMADSVHFDGKYLCARLALQAEALILAIEGGKQEVSAGYYADTRFADGVSPEGESYDAIRDRLLYNHTAIVAAGRAGSTCQVALDSIEEIPPTEVKDMIMLTIDGAEVAADKAQATIDSKVLKLTQERDAAVIKFDATKGEVNGLTSELKDVKAKLAVATSKETLDAAVAAELKRLEGVKGAAERKAAVAKHYPTLDLSKYSQDSVDALHDTLVVEDAADPEGTKRLAGRSEIVTRDGSGQDTTTRARPKVLRGRAAMLHSYTELDNAVDEG